MTKSIEILSGFGPNGLGQSLDTVVLDRTTGAKIDDIREVHFQHRAGELPEATLIVNAPKGRFQASNVAVIECCPYCGHAEKKEE